MMTTITMVWMKMNKTMNSTTNKWRPKATRILNFSPKRTIATSLSETIPQKRILAKAKRKKMNFPV